MSNAQNQVQPACQHVPAALQQEAFDAKASSLADVAETAERLAKVYRASGAHTMKLDCPDMRLTFSMNVPQVASGPATAPLTPPEPGQGAPALQPVVEQPAQEEDPDITQVKAPLVGVFYAAPAPDAQPFVIEGQKVAKGDVLCIVEAMKFMNEICAPCDGTVERISAQNARPVEYNQLLLTIRS